MHDDCVRYVCALVSPSVVSFVFTHFDKLLPVTEQQLQVFGDASLFGEKKDKKKKIDSTSYYGPLLDYEAVVLGEMFFSHPS